MKHCSAYKLSSVYVCMYVHTYIFPVVLSQSPIMYLCSLPGRLYLSQQGSLRVKLINAGTAWMYWKHVETHVL